MRYHQSLPLHALGFEFGPACVQIIEELLCLLHGEQGCLQPHGIGGHRRVFDHCAFLGNALLGGGHSIFDARELARFQVGKLLLCSRASLFLLSRRLDLLLRLSLPRLPLPVIGEALCIAAPVQSQHTGADPVEHVAVVSDQHQCSAKFQQAFFQDLEGWAAPRVD